MRAGIVGLAFSTKPRWARYVPLRHQGMHNGPQLTVDEALATLKPLLEDASVEKVGHDLKFDAVVLERHGVRLAGLGVDTMLASYLLDATRSGHPLEDASLEHLGYKALTEEDVCGRGAKARRAGRDSSRRGARLRGRTRGPGAAARRSAGPAAGHRSSRFGLSRSRAAAHSGARGDRARGRPHRRGALAAQSQHVERELATRSAQIFELAGESFNINSPKQLSEILFEKLKLPALKRTGKTRTASTAVEVLEELALGHELPRLILEWRALQKLKGTYIDALPQLVNPETGRVHTCFNQAVAATGRLSSSDPNLQNIPIRTELGREIRRAFIADPGTC